MLSEAAVSPYASAAREKYEALKLLYATNDKMAEPVVFWRLGNAFDTIIDYLDTIDSSSADFVASMVVTRLDYAIKKLGGYDEAWFDDFGWWSVASERALQKPYFKAHADSFKTILSECWGRFTANAPFVWARRQPNTFDDYGPAQAGGVWNAYWTGTAATYPGPKNGDPSNGRLIGIQNTVTNALYLMAAHRLGSSDPDTQKATAGVFHFLTAWLDEASYPLWWTLDNNAGLVRERVGHFANSKTKADGFLETWAWAGDQGLMLGNLSDAMLQYPPLSRGPLRDRIKALLAGVSQGLTNTDHVLRSFSDSSPPDQDYNDYETGSGVFWRNALYVWKTNSDLGPDLTSKSFQTMLRASAESAASTPASGLSFDVLANDLAVLVAASAMLP
jgi:hypothetical protein